MKRYITFFATFALVVSTALMSTASPVFAKCVNDNGTLCQSQTDASYCVSTYNKQEYATGSAKAKQYQNSGCDSSDAGNCSTKTVTKSGKKFIQIACKKPVATDNSSANTGSDTSQYQDPAMTATPCNQDQCNIVSKYVNPFITLLTVLVGLAITIGIIWGGIQIATSAGDPQKNANGRRHIQNALIGLVAYVILFAFLQWVVPGGLK